MRKRQSREVFERQPDLMRSAKVKIFSGIKVAPSDNIISDYVYHIVYAGAA
jgi:hypothetical protein